LLDSVASYGSLSFADTANGATISLGGNVIFALAGISRPCWIAQTSCLADRGGQAALSAIMADIVCRLEILYVGARDRN